MSLSIVARSSSRACRRISARILSSSQPVHISRATIVPGRCFVTAEKGVNGAVEEEEAPTSTTSSSKDTPASSSLAASLQWRRTQLDKLENKFKDNDQAEDSSQGSTDRNESDNYVGAAEPIEIKSDDELQPMWRDMESRVTRRRSLTAAQRGPGKVGRRNIRKSDEDMWLESGLYDNDEGDGNYGKYKEEK